MMRAKLLFEGEVAGEVACSLDPDNLPGMNVEVRDGEFEVEFSAEKVGTLLATADDLIMNIKIAEDMLNREVGI
ncbi:MAG TPA: KEOPS complex subunit Pcc1 [Methanothrix sp.]|nr:KEOPS complex subunit Pcc1 [Methanothrix sp.]HPJ85315.1 KEOPS complex subunit Pcc1 [Methanothrix sp.]HPR67636.1 KEOPS complex subunit Pcc1 [Methanothrix sp.]